MINKTKWLSGLAVVAVLGSAATPMIASAHGADDGERAAQSVQAAAKVRASGALATALGVEPAALEAAIKAAIEATPKPASDDKKDPAAREAYRTAFEANLAAGLGLTVEQLHTAIKASRTATVERVEHENILGRKLADALNITPDALAEAVKAARAAVPPLTGEQQRDSAVREAYAAAVEAAIAQHLGITLEAFNAAQAAAKTETGERREAAKEKAQEHFLQVLNRLVGAGVITQAQADEILAQYNLGGEAQAQVVKRLRSLLQEQKAEEHFQQLLDRLIGAGVLTQSQADEILAQYNLGGEAQAQVVKRLRSLLQEQKEKDQERDGKREEKRERRDEKRPDKKPAIERLLKQRRANAI